MKIIAIGDPHFKVENIKEVELFIQRLEIEVKQRQPDLIVCLGDLLDTHERLHTSPLNKTYDFIFRMSQIAPIYILVGNHDMINHCQFLTENHWMNVFKGWKNVTIVDKVHTLEIHEQILMFCPYVPPGRFGEALDTSPLDWQDHDKISCIFAHQEFYGCVMGPIKSEEGDKWDLKWPLVVSGHIHSHQIPQPNIYYTGSAMQHAFGESEYNIILELNITRDVKEDVWKHDFVTFDLGLPRKRILYKDIKDIDKTFNIPDKYKDDRVKISISGTKEQFKTFKKTTTYKKLCKKGVKVVFNRHKVNQQDLNDRIESEIKEKSFEETFIDMLKDSPSLLSLYKDIKSH